MPKEIRKILNKEEDNTSYSFSGINLQLFASGDNIDDENDNDTLGDDNLDEENDEGIGSSENNNPKDSEGDIQDEGLDDEDDDEEAAFLKRKLKIMEDESELSVQKMQNLENELQSTKESMNEMKEILQAIASQTKQKPKKTRKPSSDEVAELASKEILINQVKNMEKKMKARDERDFINSQIKAKPYVEKTVKKMKIQTKNDYIRFVMPIEEDLKEQEELRNITEKRSERNVLSEYGLTVPTAKDSKTAKKIERGKQLGGSIINKVLR